MTSPHPHQEQLEIVRRRYARIAVEESGSCCGPSESAASSCCDNDATPQPMSVKAAARQLGYTEEQLAALPEGEDLSLGCGNPLTAALLEPGLTVLDLGSGAGFDAFIAAREVGETGHVIGVDMTPEMIARAHRVLREGGRLAISDVVRIAEFPSEMKADADSLSACIAGAASVPEVESWLREAGFTDIRIATNEQSDQFIKDWVPGSGAERFVQSAIIEARK